MIGLRFMVVVQEVSHQSVIYIVRRHCRYVVLCEAKGRFPTFISSGRNNIDHGIGGHGSPCHLQVKS